MECSYFLLLLSLAIAIFTSVYAIDVSHDGRAIIIDGQRRILLSGSIHYPRSTAEMWPDLIKKAKDGGLDAIQTYVFWNAHEPVRREYNFDGNLDLVRFIQIIQNEGLYVVLCIGPYVCAEWNYGGFPVWLHNLPGIELRTNNTVYMNEMQNFTTFIVDKLKKEKLFATQGGPIILAQVENEYGNVMAEYGAAGKIYINWCSNMAQSLNIGVPWIMCQQDDAPQPMINTCNGWYCDSFYPNNPNSPKMWTENWTGWFKSWGGLDPLRMPEDVAFSVARFFQLGGSFQNYYMYHGGTNFGRTAGGPYITTSYDYDAPLTEYGSLNQPKYGHLKQLHDALHSIEKILVYGDVNTTDLGNSLSTTIYTYNGTSSCFFGNANQSTDANVTYRGVQYNVPAWSVSILPDCKNEVYNTAKVNTQTSVRVKKPNGAENEPSTLKWSWLPEDIHDTVVEGKGDVSTTRILDQKAANDVSDYLWYMTSLDLEDKDPVWSDNMTIRVNGSGNVLHVYVNGKYIASEWATYGISNQVFERNVTLKPGTNQLTFLSATVGQANYGPDFDKKESGIAGPVEIVGRKGDETVIKDLSAHKWTYKSGLNGIAEGIFNPNFSSNYMTWNSEDVPTHKKYTWYKTTFKAPLGLEPVAVDLQGLGKGFAWVNGNNLGRYWPSYLATEDGCSDDPCDYRGSYTSTKCTFNCGKPTQRWYHVPRSFLNEGENELVLFEEFGGNPSNVNFQTVVVGTACGSAYENHVLELTCEGRPISAIKFASFGDSKGQCGSYQNGTCEGSNDALSIVQKQCVGKESCSITASENVFGSTNCPSSGAAKRLLVEAVC